MADRPGLRFMFGIYGIEPTQESIRLLKETGAAGVVLLRRNIETTDQVRGLVEGLEDALGYRLLVAVDHEGGLVTRFGRDITPFPGNMALGRSGTPSLAFDTGRLMAHELASARININLAPVLDLATPENHATAIRSFAADPKLASVMGSQLIRGLQETGVSATVKHFPGRGAAVAATRSELPVVSLEKGDMEELHLAPFRAAVAVGADLVMTSHVCYSAFDPTPGIPATFSKAIITDLLRLTLGYDGVIMTDDLTSTPVVDQSTIEESVFKAALAGHDLLYLAHDAELQRRAFNGYRQTVEGGQLQKDEIEASHRRILKLLEKHSVSKASFSSDEDIDAASLSEVVSSVATHVERDPQKLIPIPAMTRVGILIPRLMDIGEKIVVDDELKGVAGLMQNWIQNISTTVDVLEIPLDPKGDLFTMITEWASAVEVTVFFCFDAKQIPGQRRVLEELQVRCPKLIVVPIRNPWDRELIDKHAAIVQTYGFRVSQIEAAVDLLFRKS